MIDAYRIGVKIAMTNGVSAVLAVIQKDVLGLHKTVEMTNGGFNKMKLAIAGLGAVTLGGGMLVGLYELSKAGEKYTHQLELMKIARQNMPPLEAKADMDMAIAAANRVSSQVLTSSPTSNLQTIGELRSVFGDTKEAIQFLPQMQKLSAIFASITGGTPEKLGYTTMRGVEMMGGTVNPETGQMDVARAGRMVDLITQATIASHGKVGPQEWLQFAQQASGVVKKMDPSALILGMMPIIQEMGGFRAGTALTSMNQQIVGGVMPQRVVADWEKFGLIDMKKVTETKTGVRVGPGGIVGEETWKRNPLEWIESVFIPKLHAQGVKDADISDQIIRLFSRQTSQREASLMATQLVRINKDVAMAQQAATSAPGANELLANDPATVRAGLDAQTSRLFTDLGRALTPSVVAGMSALTKGIAYLAEVVEAHPTATKWILGTAAALGAVLVVAGTIAIAVAAFMTIGWIPLAIAAVTVGLTVMGAAIVKYWTSIKTWTENAVMWLPMTLMKAMNWFATHDLGQMALNGLASVGNAIMTWISNLLGQVWNFVKHPLGGSDAPSSAPGGPLSIANGYAPVGGFGPPPASSFSKSGFSDDHASAIGDKIAGRLNGATVHMDGKAVGSLVVKHIGDDAYKPPSGTSIFDTRQAPSFANFPGR